LISAFTLLPLARYVHDIVLALEEQTHDASDDPQVPDHAPDPITTNERNPDDTLEDFGRGAADTIDKTLGRIDSPSPEGAGARGRRAQ
jgi:hypothetical protein